MSRAIYDDCLPRGVAEQICGLLDRRAEQLPNEPETVRALYDGAVDERRIPLEDTAACERIRRVIVTQALSFKDGDSRRYAEHSTLFKRATAGHRLAPHLDVSGYPERVLTGILFLNDCESGALRFGRFDSKERFVDTERVLPRAGRLVLFDDDPSNAHMVDVLEVGARYNVTVWFRNALNDDSDSGDWILRYLARHPRARLLHRKQRGPEPRPVARDPAWLPKILCEAGEFSVDELCQKWPDLSREGCLATLAELATESALVEVWEPSEPHRGGLTTAPQVGLNRAVAISENVVRPHDDARYATKFRRAKFVSAIECAEDCYRLHNELTKRGVRTTSAGYQLWRSVSSDRSNTEREILAECPADIREENGDDRVLAILRDMCDATLLESESTTHGYEGVAHIYDARPPYGPRLFSSIQQHVRDEHLKSVVEVGCGTGVVLKELAALSPTTLSGVDVSQAMLDVAERRLSGAGVRVELHQAMAEMLPFPDASVTLLVVGSAIHWFDQGGFWREALRVLAPEHRIIVFNRMVDRDRDDPISQIFSWHPPEPRMQRDPLQIFPLPDATMLLHYEQFTESFEVANEEQFRNMLRSWSGASSFFPAVDRFVNGTSWPVRTSSTVTFSVLKAARI